MFFGKIVDRRDHILCGIFALFLSKTSEKGPFQTDLVILFIYIYILKFLYKAKENKKSKESFFFLRIFFNGCIPLR